MSKIPDPAPRQEDVAQAKEEQVKEVPVVLEVPEDVQFGVYCNFMQARFNEHEFLLTFARFVPETITEEQAVARAVARIIVPHHLLPRIIAALSSNLKKFQERKGKADSVKPGETTSQGESE